MTKLQLMQHILKLVMIFLQFRNKIFDNFFINIYANGYSKKFILIYSSITLATSFFKQKYV